MVGISQMGGGFPARHLPAGLRDLSLSGRGPTAFQRLCRISLRTKMLIYLMKGILSVEMLLICEKIWSRY